MKFSPDDVMFMTEIRDALCPDEVIIAPTPDSSSATFFSTHSTVGLLILEYICPSFVRSKSFASSSLLSYEYVVD